MMIVLSEAERALLLSHLETSALASALLPVDVRGAFDLAEDDCDTLRDACGDLLLRIGFGEEYRPTPEGLLLEGLIDKLYCGP